MKKIIRIFFSLVLMAAVGCSLKKIDLPVGESPADIENPYSSRNKLAVPVEVRMFVPDRIPARGKDFWARLLPGGKLYYYPLRSIVAEAFKEALTTSFLEPDLSSDDDFMIVDIRVSQAYLDHKGEQCTLKMTINAEMRDANERSIVSKIIKVEAESPFDRNVTPEAVWRASYDAAFHFTKYLRSSPKVIRAARRAIAKSPEKHIFECSLGVYDLAGKQYSRAYSRAEREIELKEMSGRLVDILLEGWCPTDKPRVAVLPLVEDNKEAREAQLGQVIAPFIEEALAGSGEVNVISRMDVKLILDEIDFQKLDLTKKSAVVKVEEQKIENVDYLLIGHVSLLGD